MKVEQLVDDWSDYCEQLQLFSKDMTTERPETETTTI